MGEPLDCSGIFPMKRSVPIAFAAANLKPHHTVRRLL